MKDDRIYLFHIRDAIQHILNYSESSLAVTLQL